MPHRVEILPSGKTVRVGDKTRLSDALRKAGLAPPAYCRRRGVCGQCFVEIVSGRLPAFRPGEQDLLERRGLSARHRLACLFLVESDLRLRIPESALPGRVSVVEFGPAFSLPLDPAVKKFAIHLPPSPTGESCAEVDVLLEKLGMSRPTVPLEVLRKWPALLGRSDGLLTAVVSNEETLIDLEPGDTSERALGLAFDVGTTTLAAALVDLSTGRVLSRDACLNGQAAYGADVIARINLVLEKPGRAETLRKTVLSDLTALAASLMSSAGVEGETVYAASFAGNTVMSHLLLGLPVDTLAVSPFSSLFSSLSGLSASAMGIPFLHPRAPIYIAPVIRSFIGGDTSAGLAASGFLRQRAPALYLDLGTNGEAVLKTGRGLTAASAAAGPAFEGMNISHGMLARTGAICRVEAQAGGFRLWTIDDAPARGLCGTGLIDAAAAGLEVGLISPRGAIAPPSRAITLTRGVTLSQKDVRELQLAVGAIRAGVRMLLDDQGLRARDLRTVSIAGAFGSRLSIDSGVRLGLLPDIPRSRFRFLGNASLSGAVAFLLSLNARRGAEAAAGAVRHFSLAAQPGFQDVYLSSLEFNPWS